MGLKGGSGGGDPQVDPTTGKPIYPNLPGQMQFDAYMPGQKEALTSQLQAGYGSLPKDMNTHMGQTTADMTIPRLREPISVTQEALKSGDWNMPDQNYSTGSFALDALLGLPSAQPAAFTPGGVVPTPVPKVTNPGIIGGGYDQSGGR